MALSDGLSHRDSLENEIYDVSDDIQGLRTHSVPRFAFLISQDPRKSLGEGGQHARVVSVAPQERAMHRSPSNISSKVRFSCRPEEV